jgi:diguanylate cyclase (GGDEF)-like protein/PAS domain S-box-containing protein
MPIFERYSNRQLIAVIWVFVALVIGVIALAWYSISILGAGRAYTAGEAMWSKGQKDAVYYLARYARHKQEEDWAAYQNAISVPLGDRRARLELEKTNPNLGVAREGFLAGRNHPDEVAGMIWLFRTFRDHHQIAKAIDIWGRGDLYIGELMLVADRLRAEVQKGNTNGPEIGKALQDINRLHSLLAPLEDEFSSVVGNVQRQTEKNLITLMVVSATFLLLAAVLFSRRVLVRHREAQDAIYESENQLRNMLQEAPLPLLITQPKDRRIVYANDRAIKLLNITEPLPTQFPLQDLYDELADRLKLLQNLEHHGHVRDMEIRLRDARGMPFWALVSAQDITWQGEQCAFVAFNDIDERKRLQDDMQFRAYHDELTDLPNRALFMDALTRALGKAQRRSTRFSLLFIDLDRFKEANDTLGHQTGDELLISVADRLRAAVRDSDLVARLGGDEFVVLIDDHDTLEDVALIASNLLTVLSLPFPVEGRHISLTASIGISTYPANGTDLATLVKNADIAMYQAKEQGRNNYQFYAASLDTLSLQRLDFETRLRNALANDEFILHYQPVINLETGRICMLEALLRWQDPELGLTLPGKFMPFAEDTGAIVPIGKWALGHACRDLASWRAGMPEMLNVTVAVNLSARQFLTDDVLEDVEHALVSSQLPPNALELEITESVMMKDHNRASRLLHALRRRGTGVAIDDFGIGHSSLAQMKRLPADCLKIDRTFIEDCADDRESAAIVRAIIVMAHNLGLRVIAEGVETEEQVALLALLGCDMAQGWYFSAAVPGDNVPTLVRECRWPTKALMSVPKLHSVRVGGIRGD